MLHGLGGEERKYLGGGVVLGAVFVAMLGLWVASSNLLGGYVPPPTTD